MLEIEMAQASQLILFRDDVFERQVWAWGDEYQAQFPAADLSIVRYENFAFLIDDGGPTYITERETRVVVAFGRSVPPTTKRDLKRMRELLGPTEKAIGKDYDKGHFIAHTMGGDVLESFNWFPQLRAVNRGWNEDGKAYRKIEIHCAENPGMLYYSRPIYGDETWLPVALEAGNVEGMELVGRVFGNR